MRNNKQAVQGMAGVKMQKRHPHGIDINMEEAVQVYAFGGK